MSEIVYFAMTNEGKFVPVGTREELCDEVVNHLIESEPLRYSRVTPVEVQEDTDSQFSKITLSAFGACAIIGAFTIAHWLWLAVSQAI
jgi:hypothetical protein